MRRYLCLIMHVSREFSRWYRQSLFGSHIHTRVDYEYDVADCEHTRMVDPTDPLMIIINKSFDTTADGCHCKILSVGFALRLIYIWRDDANFACIAHAIHASEEIGYSVWWWWAVTWWWTLHRSNLISHLEKESWSIAPLRIRDAVLFTARNMRDDPFAAEISLVLRVAIYLPRSKSVILIRALDITAFSIWLYLQTKYPPPICRNYRA